MFNECHKILNTTKRNQQSTNKDINKITYSGGIKFLPFWEGPDDGERAQDSFAYSNPIKVEAITLKKNERGFHCCQLQNKPLQKNKIIIIIA